MKTYYLKEIIDKIKNYSFVDENKIITINDGELTIILKENFQLIEFLITNNIDRIKEQFGDIELNKISDDEYKEIGLE